MHIILPKYCSTGCTDKHFPDKPGLIPGFTPLEEDIDKCFSELYDGGDDYRLFYRGKGQESIERDKRYFPDLSQV